MNKNKKFTINSINKRIELNFSQQLCKLYGVKLNNAKI